jgi:hypothetical protein
MSTRLNSLLGLPDDPREVELIQSILEKTRQGKIPWVKQGNAFTATIPNGFQTNFVLSSLSFAGLSPSTWELFTIRDSKGNELVRVGNTGIASILAGSGALSPLATAANELFKAVFGAVGDDLDRAINAIKRL